MTEQEIKAGLKADRVLIQNSDCSTAEELEIVNRLVRRGKAFTSDWEMGRCSNCGYYEMQRKVTRSCRRGRA